jgi:nucleoside-diphosphate-sugar epimerase
MNVLITGAGGFIGSHLVDSQLAKGHQVVAFDLHLDRLAHAANHPNLKLVEGDVTSHDMLGQIIRGMEVVFHLASAHLDVTLPHSYYEKVNVSASHNLVKLAHQAGVKKYIHCSSVGVIGDVENPPADEETELRPTNIYEKTKLEGEQSVLQYSHQYDYPVVIARPAWVYGPRCPRTAKLFRSIKKGRFFLFGQCNNLRHPIYITDAVNGLELCAQVEHNNSQIYILAGERPVTVRELVTEIAAVVGSKPPFIRFPLFSGVIAGYLIQFLFQAINKPPPLSRRTIDFFSKNNAYDITKARQYLSFNAQVDLKTGLFLSEQAFTQSY